MRGVPRHWKTRSDRRQCPSFFSRGARRGTATAHPLTPKVCQRTRRAIGSARTWLSPIAPSSSSSATARGEQQQRRRRVSAARWWTSDAGARRAGGARTTTVARRSRGRRTAEVMGVCLMKTRARKEKTTSVWAFTLHFSVASKKKRKAARPWRRRRRHSPAGPTCLCCGTRHAPPSSIFWTR